MRWVLRMDVADLALANIVSDNVGQLSKGRVVNSRRSVSRGKGRG